MTKRRFRKKHTPESASKEIENTHQLIDSVVECIKTRESKDDKLISALVWKSREEIIKENKKQLVYLNWKLDYLYSFAPDYKPLWSFTFLNYQRCP